MTLPDCPESIPEDDLSAHYRAWKQVYEKVFQSPYPQTDFLLLRTLARIFAGEDLRFQALDTPYHDWYHMLQTAQFFNRLFDAYQEVNQHPWTPHHFRHGLWACLLHDSGYLKEKHDTEGTGAKYTSTHVPRGQHFAQRFLAEQNWPHSSIQQVVRLIGSTQYNQPLNRIDYADESEWILAQMVVTADFISQFSCERYPEKITSLFAEFTEAWDFGDVPAAERDFPTDKAMMQQSSHFWEYMVKPKLENEAGGLLHYLADPYPDGPNRYLERITQNLDRIRTLADSK